MCCNYLVSLFEKEGLEAILLDKSSLHPRYTLPLFQRGGEHNEVPEYLHFLS